jgi:hypothetical protein
MLALLHTYHFQLQQSRYLEAYSDKLEGNVSKDRVGSWLLLVTTTWKKLMSPYNSFSLMDNMNLLELLELMKTILMGRNTAEERVGAR